MKEFTLAFQKVYYHKLAFKPQISTNCLTIKRNQKDFIQGYNGAKKVKIVGGIKERKGNFKGISTTLFSIGIFFFLT